MAHEESKIFISITSGFIGRNILSVPDAFLVEVGHAFDQVVLLVPESTVDFYKSQYGSAKVVVEGVSEAINRYEVNSLSKKVLRFFYVFLLWNEGVKRLAWSGSYNESAPKNSLFGRLSYYFKWFIGHTFGRSHFIRSRCVPWLVDKIHQEEHFNSYFEKYNPSMIFTPNIDRWSDMCLIREARQRSIPSVGMPGSWDHFPKRFRPVHPDLLLVSTYTQRQEAIDFQSYSPAAVHVVGTPYYDAFFQRKSYLKDRVSFCNELGFDPKKMIIFFSSEAIYSPDDGEVADIIYQAIKSGVIYESAQLMIRPYPGVPSEHEKFDSFADHPDVYVDWMHPGTDKQRSIDLWHSSTFEEVIHFMNCLEHADVVVNSYSSIALEAAYFNRQAIWVNFDGRKEKPFDRSVRRLAQVVHLQHLIETKGVYMANSPVELLQQINGVLAGEQNPFLEVLRHKMCGPLDGKAGKRIVEHLMAVAKVQ